METREFIPFEASHPGSLIKDELKARGISQKELALDIDMQPTMLNEIINEKRAITAEIALALEKALGIPADYWMRYQVGYELNCARIKERNILKTRQIETWGLIKQYVPVRIFSKLGVLSNSLSENILRIWDIYEVDSIDELVQLVSVHKNLEFYKKSDKLKNDQINVLAWSKYARWKAKSEEVSLFDPSTKNDLIAELNALFYRNSDVVAKTKQILNSFGIKFLVIERFKQSPIDGYSFWSKNNPAIIATLRKKQLDNFAFTVMHELGHVFKHLLPDNSKEFLDIEFPNNDSNEKEQEAHKFAQQSFIDDLIWQNFLSKNPFFIFGTTEGQIVQLASEIEVHPSIILGRYCYETNNYAVKTNIDRTIN